MSYKKKYNEKWFEIDENLRVHCWTEDTRYGFRHLATIHATGASAKECYYNRTWEAWDYQTVLKTLAEKVNPQDAEKIRTYASDDHYDNTPLRAVSMVAALGSILCDTPKESNDWKVRMLKAGITGIDIPDDWDTLTEEEKTRRLDAAIGVLNQ